MQATEVRNFALIALVVCALVHGELLKFSKVDIAFSHDSTLDVEALLFSLLQTEAFDGLLVITFFIKFLAKERHIVIEFNFLLAAGAVKVAECDLLRCPPVCEHHVKAFSMEHMSARDANTRLLAELAREANATELAFSTATQNMASLANAFFVKAREAVGLVFDTPACMSALQLHFATLEYSFDLWDLYFYHLS